MGPKKNSLGNTALAHLQFGPVVPVAQVLQVGGSVGLDRGEVVLQHVDHLRELGVAPRKLPSERGGDDQRLGS